jgi:hypothetical protein
MLGGGRWKDIHTCSYSVSDQIMTGFWMSQKSLIGRIGSNMNCLIYPKRFRREMTSHKHFGRFLAIAIHHWIGLQNAISVAHVCDSFGILIPSEFAALTLIDVVVSGWIRIATHNSSSPHILWLSASLNPGFSAHSTYDLPPVSSFWVSQFRSWSDSRLHSSTQTLIYLALPAVLIDDLIWNNGHEEKTIQYSPGVNDCLFTSVVAK